MLDSKSQFLYNTKISDLDLVGEQLFILEVDWLCLCTYLPLGFSHSFDVVNQVVSCFSKCIFQFQSQSWIHMLSVEAKSF